MTMTHADKELKTCLITGGNGYLGKHIYASLATKAYQIATLGRAANNTYRCDISKEVPVFTGNFDFVIHCAGKVHSFPKTDEDNQAFFEVNVNGTQNLLLALEKMTVLPKHFVFMSSVSVYGLNEGFSITENCALQSKYPYGRSKIKAEELIKSWCKNHGITCLILRLPLLAGKNPPGNLNMMINGIKNGYYFNISGGTIRKSIVMAEDVAEIIPKALSVGGTYNLTDGHHPSFKELAGLIATQLGLEKPKSLPIWASKLLSFMVAKLGFLSPINAYKFEKLKSNLTFDDSNARKMIGWNPRSVLDNFKIK